MSDIVAAKGSLSNPIPVNFIFDKTVDGEKKYYAVYTNSSSGVSSSVSLNVLDHTPTEEDTLEADQLYLYPYSVGGEIDTIVEPEEVVDNHPTTIDYNLYVDMSNADVDDAVKRTIVGVGVYSWDSADGSSGSYKYGAWTYNNQYSESIDISPYYTILVSSSYPVYYFTADDWNDGNPTSNTNSLGYSVNVACIDAEGTAQSTINNVGVSGLAVTSAKGRDNGSSATLTIGANNAELNFTISFR